jgi:hypothetical protein
VGVLELILGVFFSKVLYPAMMEFALRRETDAVFKAATDEAYADMQKATSTIERWKALRKMREAEKKASTA